MAESVLTAGFADPVFDAQAAFRRLLAALSEPGTVHDLGSLPGCPEGLHLASAIALLALADHETPVFLAPGLRHGAAGGWLRFHCGARLTAEPGQAAFAVIEGMDATVALADFPCGEDRFPDRSATVIVQCAALEGGAPIVLTGPGIAGERTIRPAGLHEGFQAQLSENASLYPLGVDLFLICGSLILGLPRSTQAVEGR